MCTFLERWAQRCSWHAAAEDMAQELEDQVAIIREYVPELIVPDNARAVIARPDRYEPRANDTVLDFPAAD